MNDSPIGLIGVGLLGTALAERMLAGGLPILAFDLKPSQAERLSQLGGQVAPTARDVAARCDRIVLCLPDSQVVEEVVNLLGERLATSTLLVDATTGDPDQTIAMAERLADRGIGYIDATIAGSSEEARRGQAVVIIGGRDNDVHRAQPV